MKIDQEKLNKIIYALTIADRPSKRLFWISRGFGFFNRKPGSLLSYWNKRLARSIPGDIDLYNDTILKYEEALSNAKRSQEDNIDRNNPNLKDMSRSLTGSVSKWISSGLKMATDTQVESRKNICILCPFWDSSALKNTGRCTKCGCSTWAKIRLATESCPIGKW